jgi:hypothetical protein
MPVIAGKRLIARAKAVLSAVAGSDAGCMRRRGRFTTDLPLPQERVDAELAPVAVVEHRRFCNPA